MIMLGQARIFELWLHLNMSDRIQVILIQFNKCGKIMKHLNVVINFQYKKNEFRNKQICPLIKEEIILKRPILIKSSLPKDFMLGKAQD